jgi:4-oxalocrotonate tautomerase
VPVVTVQMLSGRSDDQKRSLVKAMTDAMVTTCGVSADAVWVIVNEVERENWAAGGVTYADKAKS